MAHFPLLLRRVIFLQAIYYYLYADMAELADALDLGSSPSGCRFDSCYPHFLYNFLCKKIRPIPFLKYWDRAYLSVIQMSAIQTYSHIQTITQILKLLCLWLCYWSCIVSLIFLIIKEIIVEIIIKIVIEIVKEIWSKI